MFSSRQSAKCPVLKFNQGSEVFEDFSDTFFTEWSRQYVFKREFINVSQTLYKILSSTLKNNYLKTELNFIFK